MFDEESGESKQAKKEDIKKDLQKYSDYSALQKSAGGKRLIAVLKKDIISSIMNLRNYGTLSHAELQGLCAGLTEKLSVLRVIYNAKNNRTVTEIALKELEPTNEQ